MDFWTITLIVGAAVALSGAIFCFVLAGALATERKPQSNAADMLNLFGITPINADRFMWPVDSAA
ncbi:membrane protein [Microbacterium phage Zooman]|nr:membrane protein [Microbacterium phage Zooman]UDL16567.1 membrane protein [Microbacterium phage Zooman]